MDRKIPDDSWLNDLTKEEREEFLNAQENLLRAVEEHGRVMKKHFPEWGLQTQQIGHA